MVGKKECVEEERLRLERVLILNYTIKGSESGWYKEIVYCIIFILHVWEKLVITQLFLTCPAEMLHQRWNEGFLNTVKCLEDKVCYSEYWIIIPWEKGTQYSTVAAHRRNEANFIHQEFIENTLIKKGAEYIKWSRIILCLFLLNAKSQNYNITTRIITQQ